MIWILIFVEILTFGIALIVLGVSSRDNPELYHQSRLQLNATLGTVNTVFLLVSGYFMAVSVQYVKKSDYRTASRNILYALAGGLLFVIVKTFEYADKIEHGLTIGYNKFYTFYWLLTAFHLIHVLVGMGILSGLYLSLRKGMDENTRENTETGAAFWHMCDIIWLLLFPVLYLIF
jgi:nitric oxide reductase NorE protein